MFKLSKKVEYGILAMQYISANPDKMVSAKEISEQLSISFEFLSKTLQQLIKSGLIASLQGTRGGYSLGRNADSITVSDVILALEGKTAIVNCFDNKDEENCQRTNNCTIKHSLFDMQQQIEDIFTRTTIAEMSQKSYQKLSQ
jgi:Rrf2 family nitric oxide-sensitive transcriptional repressor